MPRRTACGCGPSSCADDDAGPALPSWAPVLRSGSPPSAEQGADGQRHHDRDELAPDHDAVDVDRRAPGHVTVLDDVDPGGFGREAAAAKRERRLANEAWLRRVPDDPGGLLRAKFRLEYERRQQGGIE